jgi:hypothetical protein
MQKRIALSLVAALFLTVGFSGVSHVMADKKPATVKDVTSLPEHEQVKPTLSAVPHISPKTPAS